MLKRVFAADLVTYIDREVTVKGWARFVRNTKSTTFIVFQDVSGTVQLVGPADLPVHVKCEDVLEIVGRVRKDQRAPRGFEIDIVDIRVIGNSAESLPFLSGSDLTEIGLETVLDYRPLALRTDRGGTIFRVEAALVEGFRSALRRRRFTEIFSSKIVAGGTEGGANFFAIRYFERVFETGHVYRAEPHATSRHLTEYYSLDFEMGFINGPEDIIEVEREILTEMFENVRQEFGERLSKFDAYPPAMLNVPIWTFDECLDRLKRAYGHTDLLDDLNPEAERQLCTLAEKETGVSTVFVLGFPLSARPFYTYPCSDGRAAAGFDLLFRGVEITTGGQRLHRRADLENALRQRGVDPNTFESHLRMFELGMPPHGGLAIGAERLTAQVLGLRNVREATLYPRDVQRMTP